MPSDQSLGAGYRVAIDIGEIDPNEDYSASEVQEQKKAKRRNSQAQKNAISDAYWAKEALKPAHLRKERYPTKKWAPDQTNRFKKLADSNDTIADYWELVPSTSVSPVPNPVTLTEVPGMEHLSLLAVKPAKSVQL